MAFAIAFSSLLTGCFSTKAAWTPYGERAQLQAIALSVQGTTTVPHSGSREILIEGGSSFYTCAIVSSGTTSQGQVTLEYVSASVAKCTYRAPDSGGGLSPTVRVTDEKYPTNFKETTLTVPPSGEPDLTFGTSGVSGLPGAVIGYAARDAKLTGFDVDRQDRLILSGVFIGTGFNDDIGFVARFDTSGEPDTTFATNGLYTFTETNCPSGTGSGADVQEVYAKAEKDGDGIKLVYNKSNDFAERLDASGLLDTSWGAESGCTKLSTIVTAPYLLNSFTLDHEDNLWLGSAAGPFSVARVHHNGTSVKQSSTIPIPADYGMTNTGASQRPRFFSKGTRMFVLAQGKRTANSDLGLLLFELEASGGNIVARTSNGFAAGAYFIPTENPATEPSPTHELVYASSAKMDEAGAVHIGAHSYFNDPDMGDPDVGFYYRYRTENWDSITQQGAAGRENDLQPSQFSQSIMSPPHSGGTAFGADIAPFFTLGAAGGLLQANGGFLIFGTNTALSFFAQATTGRFLPSGGPDSDFRNARSGDASVQVPLMNVTIGSGFTSGFAHGAEMPDGRYVAAGHFKESGAGNYNKVWVARFWP